jgi:tetratricopeptide (TPR) repeat protein
MLGDPDDIKLHEAHQYRDKAKMESVKVSAATVQAFTGNPNAHDTTMTWRYRGEIALDKDEYLFVVADELIYSILQGNINSRPIYFAPFVQDNYLIGLNSFLVSEGLSQRVTPVHQTRGGSMGPMNEALSAEAAFNVIDKEHLSKTPKRGYMLKTFSDPDARWSNEDRTNYSVFFSEQSAYFSLAENFANEGKIAEANKALDMMDKLIPPERVHYEERMMPAIAQLYKRLGNEEKAKKYSKYALTDLESSYNEIAGTAQLSTRDVEVGERYGEALIAAGDLEKAQTVLQHLLQGAPDKQSQALVHYRNDQVSAMLEEKRGDKKKAIALYDQFFANWGPAIQNNPDFSPEFNNLRAHVEELKKQLGMGRDSTAKKDSVKK